MQSSPGPHGARGLSWSLVFRVFSRFFLRTSGERCQPSGAIQPALWRQRATLKVLPMPPKLILMTTTLLQSLRDQIIDESEPLEGLLRKCLLLGAESGSTTLREWARSELRGYQSEENVPDYRRLPTPPIQLVEMSGGSITSGRRIHRLELPPKSSEEIPEWFFILQPIAELEELAKSADVLFTSADLTVAKMRWNRILDTDYQQILSLSYAATGPVIAGILSQIRTQLLDVIADLTADVPLTALPRKDQVDSAVSNHIGTQYNMTVQSASGPIAMGAKAKATTNGLSVEDAVKLLEAVQATASAEVQDGSDKEELLSAIADLRAIATETAPSPGEVMVRAGKLQTISERIGIPALSAAVGASTEALIALATSGAFG